MRIATWNLAGRWSDGHAELLHSLDADVLLLTEVSDRLEVSDYSIHRTSEPMAPRRTWAAVATREPLSTCPDPHPATALVSSAGWTFASTVMPWKGCGADPWGEGRHVDKTTRTLEALLGRLPREQLIWGGDWNHALTGREHAGSIGGRTALLDALTTLGLSVTTTDLPHRIDGLLTIDHIAVPAHSAACAAARIRASGLSDHDAYVVNFGD